PVAQDLLVDDRGTLRLGGAQPSPYSRLRFSDHAPFLGAEDYLSIGGVRIGDRTVGPVAGNVRIDRNVFAIDQLEAMALDGKITGQCIVDYSGADTLVRFRGDATGLFPGGGEVL